MVVLAQALVSRPRVLLVDELSLGLAPVVLKRLVPTLASVAASGVGVLLIEQFAHVALGLANTRLHPRGRPHPLPRDGRRAEGQPRAPALRLPPAGLARGRSRGQGRGDHRWGIGHRAGHGAALRGRGHEAGAGGHRATGPAAGGRGAEPRRRRRAHRAHGRQPRGRRGGARRRRRSSTSATCTSSATTPVSGAAACPSPSCRWRTSSWVLAVNLFGVIHGLRAFLPHLRANDVGHIVNTASTSGLYHLPRMGPYNASKAAVVALSETLRFELAAEGSRVGVSVLCPSWVRTNISTADRNRPERFAYALDTDQMAQVTTYKARRREQLARRRGPVGHRRPGVRGRQGRTASTSSPTPPAWTSSTPGHDASSPATTRWSRRNGREWWSRTEIEGERTMTENARSELLADVLSRYEGSPNPRLREITEAAIRHLHAFAEEVNLQRDEWFAGIEFLTATGQMLRRQPPGVHPAVRHAGRVQPGRDADARRGRGKHREHRARSLLRARAPRHAPRASRCSSIPTTATGS